jgi:hypothetical protein
MNIPTQFKFEQNFEELAINVLGAENINAQKARDANEIRSNTIQVYFETGEALEDNSKFIDNKKEYTTFSGSLSFLVISNRLLGNDHTNQVALVRHMMMNKMATLDSAYYDIFDIKPLASSFQQLEEDNLDSTSLVFEIIFGIKEFTDIGS